MNTVARNKRLFTDVDYEPTLEEWNWVLDRLGEAYKSELIKRTMFESELFGMNAYIILSFLDEYERAPGRVRKILERTSPEEIMWTGLPVGTKLNAMGVVSWPLNFFIGRELFVDLGERSLEDDLEDNLVILDFWRRATIALRQDGELFNMDADPPDSIDVLGPDRLGEVVGQLEDDPDEIAAYKKFGGQMAAYCFLENCDSRIAVSETGPYPLGNGKYLMVRELTADRAGDYPWTDGLRDEMEHHQFAIAYELPDGVGMETNVWGTAWFTPTDYLSHVQRAKAFVTDGGTLEPASSAQLGEYRKGIRKAHRSLYQRFSEMSQKERTLIASTIYTWKYKPWARAAGVYDDIDWELPAKVTDRYEEFADPEVAGKVLGAAFVPADRDSCYRPLV